MEGNEILVATFISSVGGWGGGGSGGVLGVAVQQWREKTRIIKLKKACADERPRRVINIQLPFDFLFSLSRQCTRSHRLLARF